MREDQDEEIDHTRLGPTSCPIPSIPKGEGLHSAAECDVEFSKDRAVFLSDNPRYVVARCHEARPFVTLCITGQQKSDRLEPRPSARLRSHGYVTAFTPWASSCAINFRCRKQLARPSPKREPTSRTLLDSASTRRCAPVVPAECATPNDGVRSKQRDSGAFRVRRGTSAVVQFPG